MAWQDGRTGTDDIYAQRVNAEGEILWTTGGMPVCTASGEQLRPTIVSDGSGGIIIAWYDRRSGSHYDAYAQRLDGSGNILWTANGVPLCTAAGDQLRAMPISDGAGGAIVTWYDARSGTYDIYAQRIAPDGNVLWAANGVAVCDAAGNQEWGRIVSDGAGGAIIGWHDSRGGGYDIYAQRVDGSGAMLWTAGGVHICGAPGDQIFRTIVTGGDGGGAVIFWEDGRDGSLDIYGQKVDSGGTPLWTTDGVAVCAAANDQDWPICASDGAGGAIVAWRDYRNPPNDRDIYIQKVDSDGVPGWDQDGKPVCAVPYLQQNIHIISDGAGGALLTWRDQRWGTSYGSHIYAQGFNSSGDPCLSVNGEAVSVNELTQTLGHIAPAGDGKAIIVWYDNRNSYFDPYPNLIDNFDIYAHLFDFGESVVPPEQNEPEILAVDDVPRDQGGKLSIQWMRSDLDAQPDMWITHYTMWRRLPLVEIPLTSFAGPDSLSLLVASKGDRPFIMGADVPVDYDGPAYRLDIASGDYAWEYMADAPAMGFENYALTVESLYDSMAGNTGWQYFMVVAHTGTPGVFYESPVDSGYSVDNLSPHEPYGFTAIQLGPPEKLMLSWEPNTDPDISHYCLYRYDGSDFVPGPENKLFDTMETEITDPEWQTGAQYYYRLAARDIHGNEGPSALITPAQVTATLLQSFSASLEERVVVVRWHLYVIDEGAEFRLLRSERSDGGFVELPGAVTSRDGLSFEFIDREVSPGMEYFYRVELSTGSESSILFETEGISLPRASLTLYQNHPNPFNPVTTIRYFLPTAGSVKLVVYDITGRLVATLVDGASPGGEHTVEWNGSAGTGTDVSSGVYFYRLDYDKESITRKMVLLR